MKKCHVAGITVVAICMLSLLILAPIVPIAETQIFIDLSSGEELVVDRYLCGLLSFEKKRASPLVSFWPKSKLGDRDSRHKVIISKSKTFLFGSIEHIDQRAGKLYYAIRLEALGWRAPDGENAQKIIDIIARLTEEDLKNKTLERKVE